MLTLHLHSDTRTQMQRFPYFAHNGKKRTLTNCAHTARRGGAGICTHQSLLTVTFSGALARADRWDLLNEKFALYLERGIKPVVLKLPDLASHDTCVSSFPPHSGILVG